MKKTKQTNLESKLTVSIILFTATILYVVYSFVSVSIALLTLPLFAAATGRSIINSEMMQFILSIVLIVLSVMVGRNIDRFYEYKKAPLLKRYKFLLIYMLILAGLCLMVNIFAPDMKRVFSNAPDMIRWYLIGLIDSIICLTPAFITILFRHYALDKKKYIKTVIAKSKTKKRQKPEDFEEL